MSPRRAARFTLYLLLMVSLLIPGIIAPAQAIADEFQAAKAVLIADAPVVQGMPCDDMDLPAQIEDPAPCDCCAPHACDLSACLGTACLPQLPHLAASAPPAAAPLPLQPPGLALGMIDNPLRPPIA